VPAGRPAPLSPPPVPNLDQFIVDAAKAAWAGEFVKGTKNHDKSVGEVWNRSDRDNVSYYAYATTACKK
jgi:hypothetical protein